MQKNSNIAAETGLVAGRCRELRDELSMLPDPDERFVHLMRLGRTYPAMDEKYRLKENLLPGCVSQLWLVPDLVDGRCEFHMDADAQITKGLAALLCRLYGGAPPAEVAVVEPDFMEELGLTQHLSPNRRNGLGNLRARIREFAKLHAADAAS